MPRFKKCKFSTPYSQCTPLSDSTASQSPVITTGSPYTVKTRDNERISVFRPGPFTPRDERIAGYKPGPYTPVDERIAVFRQGPFTSGEAPMSKTTSVVKTYSKRGKGQCVIKNYYFNKKKLFNNDTTLSEQDKGALAQPQSEQKTDTAVPKSKRLQKEIPAEKENLVDAFDAFNMTPVKVLKKDNKKRLEREATLTLGKENKLFHQQAKHTVLKTILRMHAEIEILQERRRQLRLGLAKKQKKQRRDVLEATEKNTAGDNRQGIDGQEAEKGEEFEFFEE